MLPKLKTQSENVFSHRLQCYNFEVCFLTLSHFEVFSELYSGCLTLDIIFATFYPDGKFVMELHMRECRNCTDLLTTFSVLGRDFANKS